MKSRFKSVLAGAGTLAIAGGMLLATGGSALALQTPAYEPDSNATLGGVDFFNASGVQITSGPVTGAPFAAFAVAQTTPTTSTPLATLFAATPNSGRVTPLGTSFANTFSNEQLSDSTNYPITSATPANIHGITNPVVTGAGTDTDLATYISTIPNTDSSTTDGYGNLYQMRVKVSGATGYAAATIQISGTGGSATWTQVSGSFRLFADTTTTTLTPTPASPSVPGTNVTLNATVVDTTSGTTIPVGTVSFYDGAAIPANLIGAAQPVSGTGTASVSTSTLSTATHTLTAVFTPTNSSLFATSTGTASYTIANLDTSNTALSVNPTTAPAFTAVDLTATVTDTTNNVSTPASVNGWFTEDAAPTYSTAGIVFDNSVNTGVIDYLHPVANVPLPGIAGLSYTESNTGGPQAAYDMEVDTTGPGTGYTTLAWEPYNNGLPLTGDGTVHTFSNLEAGNWWSSHIGSGPGSQASPITLSAFDTLYPHAVIISYGAHQHNAGSVSTVNHIAFQSASTTFTSNNAASTTPTGSVQFFDGATPIGSPVGLVAGVATLHDTAGFTFSAPGPTHSITAVYNGSATINGSTSAAVTFTATAPACPNGEASTLCTDPQTVEATVAAGTITITTPYSPTNPLNLGTLVLNGAGTQLSASAAFGNTSNPQLGGSEIFVTDTRAGDANWTASVQSGNFTSPSSPTTPIDGQNAGLTGLVVVPVSGNALTAANVTVTNNPPGTAPIISGGSQGLGGVKHTFAQTTAGGDGSVGFTGTFTLNAPTSTGAGLYTGTVTFTVG